MRDGLHEVKEVYEFTGLNRKQLHQCDDLGLVKPTKVLNDAGYKLYDEKALDKLLEIGLFASLGLSIQEIRDRMNRADYDRWKLLGEIIERSTLELEHLQNQIMIARLLMAMEARIPEYDSYVIRHLDELGEQYREIIK